MQDEKKLTLFMVLKIVAQEISRDKHMVMEYLSPAVDGCRAALRVGVESAMSPEQLTDDLFEQSMESTADSFSLLTICFRVTDTDESYSLVFDRGGCNAYDECVEPDVVISGESKSLRDLLDADSKTSPIDVMGDTYTIHGNNASEVVEGLGFLCFPSLLKLARSGVDPSSPESEDADQVFMVATTNMITKMVQRWASIQLITEDE